MAWSRTGPKARSRRIRPRHIRTTMPTRGPSSTPRNIQRLPFYVSSAAAPLSLIAGPKPRVLPM